MHEAVHSRRNDPRRQADQPAPLPRQRGVGHRDLQAAAHRSDAFDRRKARNLLLDASRSVLEAIKRLQSLERNELTSYLEDAYCRVIQAEGAQYLLRCDTCLGPKRKSVRRGLRIRDRHVDAFRAVAPKAMAAKLLKLEAVLVLAAEKIAFVPGDSQRDAVAQKFVDEMVYSWISGTGQMPTYATMSKNSRMPSPFASVLATINSKILTDPLRSNNVFREYAQKSITRLKPLLIS